MKVDLAVVGGGPVGALAAALIARRRPDLRLRLIARDDGAADGKHIVLNFAARRILEDAGIWNDLTVAPIRETRVSFAGCLGRLAVRAADCEVAAIGYALPLAGLHRRAREATAANLLRGEVAAIAESGGGYDLRLKTAAGESALFCRMLVVAAEIPPRRLPGDFRVREDDYRQDAVVAEARIAADAPRDIAWERFAADGALALVPRADGAFALIWSAPRPVAASLCANGDAQFAAAARQAGGGGWPRMLSAGGAIHRFALRRRMLRPIASGALAMIGQGANRVHPIGAQGLNLGLRDAGQLAELLACGGFNPRAICAAYAAARAKDHRQIIAATHGLAIFAAAPPRWARQAAAFAAAAAACAPRRLRAALAAPMIFGGGR